MLHKSYYHLSYEDKQTNVENGSHLLEIKPYSE